MRGRGGEDVRVRVRARWHLVRTCAACDTARSPSPSSEDPPSCLALRLDVFGGGAQPATSRPAKLSPCSRAWLGLGSGSGSGSGSGLELGLG